ncbi:HAD-IA family hydrolase [Psychromonas ossibalaenae]|uniref:HAD-IA family hydrolase n=1 Tax=Psychromonas ossibalaenae TaxID=444922 RepID=UPI0003767477|nr:HAD-IA family hydrolase [Psychromonas ossibalaenae]
MLVTKALLFDLDGTLVDTTTAVETLWEAWADKHKIDAAPIFAEMHGTHGKVIIAKYAPHLDIKTEITQLLIDEEKLSRNVTAVPGAKSMLENLGEVPWGIVTMSSKRVALTKLKAAGLPVPHILVTADDVLQSKPDPAPYLKGAQWLDIEPQNCLVFEDAQAGIESGLNAGMSVAQIMHAGHCEQINGTLKTFNNWADIQINMDNNAVYVK